MHYIRHWLLIILSECLLVSCQQGKDIPNFDEEAFQHDYQGCAGIRNKMKEQLFAITSELKGLTQTEMRNTLGKPDRQELASRNQKYFVYFIEPSADCSQDTVQQEPLTMYIRFSAVDRVTEVSFQNY